MVQAQRERVFNDVKTAQISDCEDVGLNATEKVVKQSKLDDYRVVYFATHGLVAGDLQEFTKAKAEPALVFTIPEKPSDLDDGLLQANIRIKTWRPIRFQI